jgi:8-oxo-dGTP diphosphatase
MNKIRVAVAVVINSDNKVLIAKRHQHLHQGGKWEFPGGKIEKGELPQAALIRELKEEVDLDVNNATPMMVLEYDYGDKFVSLDIWVIKDFVGIARGVEQQEIRWVGIKQLNEFTFPDANQPIIDSLLTGTFGI